LSLLSKAVLHFWAQLSLLVPMS